MGLKLEGSVLRCGTCGKSRGITHTCVTSATSRRRKTRTKLKPRIAVTCAECGKVRGFRHTCAPKSDFKKRRRQQATAERQRKRKAVRARQAARRRQAAAERRARQKARSSAARKRPPRSRPQGDGHEPGTCGDRDCPKFGCKAYWRGVTDCPLPHGG